MSVDKEETAKIDPQWYECVLGFESADDIRYKIGQIILEDEYITLTSSEKRFFRTVDENFVYEKTCC